MECPCDVLISTGQKRCQCYGSVKPLMREIYLEDTDKSAGKYRWFSAAQDRTAAKFIHRGKKNFLLEYCAMWRQIQFIFPLSWSLHNITRKWYLTVRHVNLTFLLPSIHLSMLYRAFESRNKTSCGHALWVKVFDLQSWNYTAPSRRSGFNLKWGSGILYCTHRN